MQRSRVCGESVWDESEHDGVDDSRLADWLAENHLSR